MRWSERQRALLADMGIVLWAAPAPTPAPAPPQGAATARRAEMPTPPAPAVPAASAAPSALATPAAPPALAASPSALPLPEGAALRLAVATCTACALCESRRQPVFGAGPERADWMIVGEAPGELEDELGEPYAGKPAQLLENMLRAVGVSTAADAAPASAAHVTTAVRCRPPGSRLPAADEIARCEPHLLRQVEWVRPKVILAMGSLAVQSLLRTREPLGKLRGRVHRYAGVPLIVSYAPSYLLRNLQDKARAWDDLCLAAETLALGAPGAETLTLGAPAAAGTR